MNGLHQNMYSYDTQSSRSPRAASYSTQPLNRQTSRQFDGLNHQALYGLDELTSQFDMPRYNDRMGSSMVNNYGGYDAMPQAWNSSGYGQNNTLAALGATTRRPSGRGGRSGIPTMWMDQNQNIGPQAGMPPMGNPSMAMPFPHNLPRGGDEEDLIPTAIVIKNIPFNVKKEQLVQVMTDLNLPLPYAFNYHFDGGVFRGLAFANFTTPEETRLVIDAMNHMELHGRKLRVEYKKMLPQAERDRIEREKRERRGQLEEQHRPMGPGQLQSQNSLSVLSNNNYNRSPSPRNNTANVDMNDPVVIKYYTNLVEWRSNEAHGESLDFSPTIPPTHRRIIHLLAHNLGLGHASEGNGENRFIRIHRHSSQNTPRTTDMSSLQYATAADTHRRGLYRAATTDFGSVRDPAQFDPTRQSNTYLGGYADSPGGLSAAQHLRSAKSHADLRSWTPSPAQSSAASFSAGLTGNLPSRYDYGQGQNSPGSSRSNITPTTSAMATGNGPMLVNQFDNLSLNNGFGTGSGSPHRLRPAQSDRNLEGHVPGPIGGHRTFSGNHDDPNKARSNAASRQPRGPGVERGSGFARGRSSGHRSRGSDELSSPTGVEPLAE